MRVLVTGGAGFIGSALCRHLVLDLHAQVIVVDKLTYAGHLSSLAAVSSSANFTFIKADICDRAAMDAVFAAHEPDAVLHLAAESHVDRSIELASEFVQSNVMGTASLLEAARDYWEKLPDSNRAAFRFQYISTDEVYGSLGPSGFFTEASPLDPHSPYAASKAAADHLVSAWHHTYGLPVLISNCSNNFGPFQLPEKLIPLVILNALENKALPVYGDGLNIRDWLFVEDHVKALVHILTKGIVAQRYNVGSRTERTNLAVVEAICDLVDNHTQAQKRRDLIRFVTDRPGHDKRYAIDPAKVEAELGWRPQESFEDALDKTVQWYIGNPQWWQPLRAAGHGKTRLGLTGRSANAAECDA